MPSSRVLYVRPTGKRLTYEIVADHRGRYTISLDGVILKRGWDPLVERGVRSPGTGVMESTIAHSKVAILYLIGMREENDSGRARQAAVGGAMRGTLVGDVSQLGVAHRTTDKL